MKRIARGIKLALLLAAVGWASPLHEKVLESSDITVDKLYRSMRGPLDSQPFQLGDSQARELFWIVGFEAEVLEGGKPASPEWLCHANLDYHPEAASLSGLSPDGRFVTLSQGQESVRFPTGFGIPVYSDDQLSLTNQALNLNQPQAKAHLRFRTKVYYRKQSELEQPMKALGQMAVSGLKSLDRARRYGVDPKLLKEAGPFCSVGLSANAEVAYRDKYGQEFTSHWVVKPGREVSQTNVTPQLELTRDVTVHYVGVHLHPYAESLELLDLTTGKSVYKSRSKPSSGRVGISTVDNYSSLQGFTLHADHRYALETVYNNTSDTETDSMSVMFFYMDLDLEARGEPLWAARTLLGLDGNPGPADLVLRVFRP